MPKREPLPDGPIDSDLSEKSSYDTATGADEYNNNNDKLEKVSQKLNEASLGQSRFLNDSSHSYERYSLPSTRVPSRDAASSSKSGSASPEHHRMVEILEPNSTDSSKKRPSAAFLSAAVGSYDRSSGESSPASTDNEGQKESMFYLANSHDANDSDYNSPSISRDQSPQSPSAASFPQADRDDPYARKHRPPPVNNLHEIAPRFVFSKLKHGGRSSSSIMSMDKPCHQSRSTSATRSERSSKALSQLNQSRGSDSEDDLSKKKSKPHGSMMELKRFFKRKQKDSKLSSPASSPKLNASSSSQNLKPSTSTANVPFMEEGFKKYGKIGRVLGSGAGGSVRLMKRQSDGTVFAVKEFRERQPTESERDYSKKVTAEFCIGSTLHHPNIIETLDIIHDGGRYYEVMEYGPYDFFAIVMSGKMSRAEIGCSFRQILSGVQYLHEMGLAHRDLKLDNCVVTEQGILKLIDFGSASVFQYPFEEDIVLAKGVVGSDPYLAPEVLSEPRYDPRPADIWSTAVIFCCMSLRRFPWKAPKMSDNSFYLFASEPHKDVDQSTITNAADIKGSWRLLRLLPQPCRHIVGRMLCLDPKSRATFDEIMANDWVQAISYCTLDKNGKLIKGDNHEHTFVPAEEAHLESYKKDKKN